jgi:hypothetical protein
MCYLSNPKTHRGLTPNKKFDISGLPAYDCRNLNYAEYGFSCSSSSANGRQDEKFISLEQICSGEEIEKLEIYTWGQGVAYDTAEGFLVKNKKPLKNATAFLVCSWSEYSDNNTPYRKSESLFYILL